ncbi:unnamed protein product [Cuscuta campestris]|uniref:Uncharacterized protein n=1 Tax=Cuscuta campestris TaxID=132261 RepID=A0A484KYL8_9ASTE|nr:unnamed protein product [Cuscuta campestris]
MEEASASNSAPSSSKVRLVRCPKCENLLPELPDFSVYQCGGCGAVLRAKKNGISKDGLPEVSDVENGRTVSSKGVIATGLESACETEVEYSGFETGKEKALHSNSSLGPKNVEAVPRDHEPFSVPKRLDLCRGDNVYDEGEHGCSNGELDDRAFRNDGLVELGVPQCGGDSSVGMEPKRARPSMESLSFRPVIDNSRVEERKNLKELCEDARQAAGQARFMDCPYSDEGSSKYGTSSYYGANECRNYYNGLDGFAKVATLENDRADLLRKIDELKDQLSLTCEVGDNKPKERISADRRTAPTTFGPIKHPLGQGQHLGYPYDRVGGPYTRRHCSMIQDPYHPPVPFRNGTLGCESAYLDEIIRKPPHQPYSDLTQMYHDHQYPGPSDLTSDLFRPHPHESRFHHPTCSCFHCFNENREASFASIASRWPRNESPNPALCQPKSSSAHGYASEGSICPNGKWLTRSSSDLNRKNCAVGLHQNRPRKVFVARGSEKVCRTIAGGAPFILCYNCFEVLKLSQKDRMMTKEHNKVRCGACSSIIVFELSIKGIDASAPRMKQVRADESIDMHNKRLHGSSGFVSPCSDDYDKHNFKYEFPDTKAEAFASCPKPTFGDSRKRLEVHSLSSSFSEHDKSPGAGIPRKDYSRSAELHVKDDVSLVLPDSPLPLDYPSSDDMADACNRAARTESADQKCIDGWASRHNSMKDACVATEMDVSIADFGNGGMPQEPTEVTKEEDRQNGKRGSDSFILGLLRRGFGELSKSGQNTENRRSNVFVNGQLISGRALKKAEKLAGPIQPGEYWYDRTAGFWGVMGHPCQGIIMPNIEEFNHPMPKNCAAGSTCVFVNGRELHKKDLDLLVRRGLPLTRNKSYLIEMSGRVVDYQTSEELDSLGKLAPTVERAGHGFGMKIPRSILEDSL